MERKMIYSDGIKEDSGDLEEIAELQLKPKEVRVDEKLGKHGFLYDTRVFSNQIQKD